MTTRSLILLARIGAPHGIKGELRVKPFGDVEMLDQYGKLQTQSGNRLKITRMRVQKGIAIVKFEGVNSRSQAEALNGIDLYVDRERLPEPEEDEFYVSDLIAMTVKNTSGETIGTITAVPNFGAGDMLEIEPADGGSSYYLPFTREVVPEVDFQGGCVTIIPPTVVSERDEP